MGKGRTANRKVPKKVSVKWKVGDKFLCTCCNDECVNVIRTVGHILSVDVESTDGGLFAFSEIVPLESYKSAVGKELLKEVKL